MDRTNGNPLRSVPDVGDVVTNTVAVFCQWLSQCYENVSTVLAYKKSPTESHHLWTAPLCVKAQARTLGCRGTFRGSAQRK